MKKLINDPKDYVDQSLAGMAIAHPAHYVVSFLSSAESGMMTGSIVDFDQAMPGCFDEVPQPPSIPWGFAGNRPYERITGRKAGRLGAQSQHPSFRVRR